MYCCELGQVSDVSVPAFVVCHNVLYRCRAQEILLLEPERFSALVVVCGIEYLGNKVGVVILAHCLIIFALREQLHIEVLHGLCFPQSEHRDSVAVFTGNHHIVSDGFNVVAVDVLRLHSVFSPLLLNLAVKLNDKRFIASVREPDFAAGKPYVGQFYLPAVYYLLFEQTKFVAKRITHCGIIAGCKRIHKACGKPAEAAVAEACIRLELVKVFKVETIRGNNFLIDVSSTEVKDAVFQRPAEQKFHAQIIDALGALCLYLFVELLSFFKQNIPDAHYDSFVHLLFGGLCGAYTEVPRQFALDCLLNLFFGNSCVHSVI